MLNADPSAPTSIGRELLFGVVGGAIAVACVLPPILHFVTGPLGPFIGGFFAAQLAKPALRGRVIIAAMVGVTLGGLFAAVALAIAKLSDTLPRWFPSPDVIALIALGVWLYATALSAAGIAANSVFQAKSAAPKPVETP